MLEKPILKPYDFFEFKMGGNWIKCQCIAVHESKDIPNKINTSRKYEVKILDPIFIGSYADGITIIDEIFLKGRVKLEPNAILKGLLD